MQSNWYESWSAVFLDFSCNKIYLYCKNLGLFDKQFFGCQRGNLQKAVDWWSAVLCHDAFGNGLWQAACRMDQWRSPRACVSDERWYKQYFILDVPRGNDCPRMAHKTFRRKDIFFEALNRRSNSAYETVHQSIQVSDDLISIGRLKANDDKSGICDLSISNLTDPAGHERWNLAKFRKCDRPSQIALSRWSRSSSPMLGWTKTSSWLRLNVNQPITSRISYEAIRTTCCRVRPHTKSRW